jgi:ferredoxin-NADP reductase
VNVSSILTAPPSPSSLLAFATTVHLGLTAIRNHRSVGARIFSPLALISLSLAALPWTFPSPIGLAFGFCAHVGWFIACEKLAARSVAGKTAPSRPAPQPAATPRPVAASAQAAPAAVPARSQAPKGFVQAPILTAFNETPLIKTVRIARPEGFDFIAGQFVTVRVRVDGKEYARCYSISSAPHVHGYLELSIKRQGIVSNALHASVRPGTMLSVKAPVGAFRYPVGDDRPIVLLAGGIGITPLISMLRHAVATEPTRKVTLVYSAHTQDDFAFRDELVTMVRRHPQVRVQLAVANGQAHPSIYPGRIDEALINTAVPDVTRSVVFICGPGAMIESMKKLLGSLGVPPAQIRHEAFQQAVAASAGLAAEPHEVRQAVGAAAGSRAVAPALTGTRSATTPTDHRMLCARTGKALPIHDGQTILEAAENGGIAVDSLCRSGVCGTCRVQVTDGNVSCESTTLDPDDQAQGFVLACVSTVTSDCSVNV